MNYLADHQTFASKHELNEAVNEHITANNYELNATDRDVLMTISRHAVKFPGAAHLKAETLAGKVGKSIITVRRVIRKLVRLQIIEKRPFIRKVKKGSGANILLILPFNDNPVMITRSDTEKPVPARDEQSKSEKETVYSLNLNKSFTNTYQAAPTFYNRFKNFIFSTIGENQSVVSKLYGVYKGHSSAFTKHGAFSREEVEHAGYEALRASVMATKNKRIKNIAGYYNGTLDRMLDRLFIASINEE